MNLKQSLVVLGTAALCGLALAQTPKVQTPAERMEALEKEVAVLRTQLTSVKTAAGEGTAALQLELAETRALANRLAGWAAAQADGAAELAKVLDDSETKGFTFGINPDSRVALLAGWRGFAAGLQKDVPQQLTPNAAKAPADGKPAETKKP